MVAKTLIGNGQLNYSLSFLSDLSLSCETTCSIYRTISLHCFLSPLLHIHSCSLSLCVCLSVCLPHTLLSPLTHMFSLSRSFVCLSCLFVFLSLVSVSHQLPIKDVFQTLKFRAFFKRCLDVYAMMPDPRKNLTQGSDNFPYLTCILVQRVG